MQIIDTIDIIVTRNSLVTTVVACHVSVLSCDPCDLCAQVSGFIIQIDMTRISFASLSPSAELV